MPLNEEEEIIWALLRPPHLSSKVASALEREIDKEKAFRN